MVVLILIGFVVFVLVLFIKLDLFGLVFFFQECVGCDGCCFKMVKFCLMKMDVEQQLVILKVQNEGVGFFFKMKDDLWVICVGWVLCKFFFDELLQFWNVFVGDMSVVGLWLLLFSEVIVYDGIVFCCFYIKFGIIGLWQVFGCSDFLWDESVCFDLCYVENWFVMNDLQIMWCMVKVMVQFSGVY